MAINLLSTLLSGADQGSTSLYSVLYGSNGIASGGDPLLALRLADKNKVREIASTEKRPEVARDITAFKAAIAKAKDPATLLKDPRFLKVMLTANGLGDQVDYPALARKALLSNVSDSKSLVNSLSDSRWKSVAKTYDFANQGLAVISSKKVQATLADGYAEVQWRSGLEETTPGLGDALSFRSRANTVTSVDQILGDPVLRRVVTTTLGIPQEIAFQPLTTQERAISTRLDISKLKNSHFVDSFSQRYLLAVRDKNALQTSNGLLI